MPFKERERGQTFGEQARERSFSIPCVSEHSAHLAATAVLTAVDQTENTVVIDVHGSVMIVHVGAEQARGSEPNDAERFQMALSTIATMPDEDDEWDGRDKFREVRAIAHDALHIIHD